MIRVPRYIQIAKSKSGQPYQPEVMVQDLVLLDDDFNEIEVTVMQAWNNISVYWEGNLIYEDTFFN